jgi:hypothetical protein
MKPAAKLGSGVACTGVGTNGTKERFTGFGRIAGSSLAHARIELSPVPQPQPAREFCADRARVRRTAPMKDAQKKTPWTEPENQSSDQFNFDPISQPFHGHKHPFLKERVDAGFCAATASGSALGDHRGRPAAGSTAAIWPAWLLACARAQKKVFYLSRDQRPGSVASFAARPRSTQNSVCNRL